MGQDIDIPANILNIYYVFSFMDPKTCRLFWLSKKHRGWIQKLEYIGPQYSIVNDSYVDLTVENGQNMPVLA